MILAGTDALDGKAGLAQPRQEPRRGHPPDLVTGMVHDGDGRAQRIGQGKSPNETRPMSVRPAACSAGTTPSDARVVALRIAVGGCEPPGRAGTASAAAGWSGTRS